MSNRDIWMGSTFLHQSLYEIARLQERIQEMDAPASAEISWQTAFYSLPQNVPLKLGDVRWSFPMVHQEQPFTPRIETLTSEHLSALLYYTYGLSRYDTGSGVVWPFHRFVASARCFFPTELYLWLPQLGSVPAGIYYYDALHHGLALIRPGSYVKILGAAADTDWRGCQAILLLASRFWKTAFKYGSFAYRLCTQEAGIVVGNTLMVAGTLGLHAHVSYQFLDRALNELLGFEPGEGSLLAMVSLYPGGPGSGPGHKQTRKENTAQALLQDIAPLQFDRSPTSALNQQFCAQMIEFDQHTFLESTAEIVTDPLLNHLECKRTEENLAPPPLATKTIELTEALYQRNSGDIEFTPLSLPLPEHVFWEIMRFSLSEYSHDLAPGSTAPRLHLYVVVNHVTGIKKGIYRLCARCGKLHVIEYGNFILSFQAIQMRENIISASANVLCLLVGDYEATSHLFGNRAYRILNLEAGLICHRLSVLSAAYGLAARYSNSYEPAACQKLLHLASPSLVPLTELIIGYEAPGIRAGERYRLPLRG